ncbi:carboxypeptidase regulatory-like domain-containing protein [Pedobacter frigiditerrae]|uniref:Carboxypeptidase regulatory-like domain-containing protein n=1 Tax=Pedobacter frigiditerrae TaxID=2530452 RepID=A0A4R0MXS3_9SPHI|nr:carboxypeptidase-like regulatory domain-containing protein [Pedobacter frigiditerrae]TCC92091.1 carboxypeptidase regulatory-like domain-containing protein [Pedobacter frigiditerrae]
MRNKAIAIKIAEPCNQNWELMDSRNDGRFCESCNKCVVDFSNHTNSEIIKFLSSSKNDVCGRLTNTQLNQLNYYSLIKPSNKNWLKYLGVLAIGISMIVSEANAINLKKPIEFANSPLNRKIISKTNQIKMIYGYVYDENQKPISGARVVITNTKLFATTDNNGRYEILLTKNFDTKNNIIKINSLRFEGSLKANYAKEKQADLAVNCVYMIMGKIAMTTNP